MAAADESAVAYRGQGKAAAAQRRLDALAAAVAETLNADLFITDREYLHEATWNVADGVTISRAEDALAILGLYLRSQGRYVVSQTSNVTSTYNKGLFYLAGTLDLLPSAWRWLAGCGQHGRGGGDEALPLLAGSLIERVGRALQDRDGVHVALNKPQNNDTADEALAALDAVLMWLMGAVDVSARVAHRVLNMPAQSEYAAGWQRDKWFEEVKRRAPALAATVGPGTDGRHALTVLRLLRNSVHGEALQPLGVVGAGYKRDATLMSLPRADQSDLGKAFTALGGKKTWGVRLHAGGQTHVDPGVLLESLLPRILRLLNEIMNETPVEQLPHVDLKDTDIQPPIAGMGVSNQEHRQSIRWQLGL